MPEDRQPAAHDRPALLVIGGGHMGQAILRGALAAGSLWSRPEARERVIVAEPGAEKHALLAGLGVDVRASAGDGVRALLDRGRHPGANGGDGVAAVILLAVKPQSLGKVAAEIGPLLATRLDGRPAGPGSGFLVISILAGTRAQRVREVLGPAARVVRAMPNLPAGIQQGMTALAAHASATARDAAFAARLFECVGRVVNIDESLMDAFTALAGSGPAYLFYLAEAMRKAGIDLGFAPQVADAVTRQTLAGAAALLQQSGELPAALRAAVTSKGGTTAAATRVLDDRGVMAAIEQAIVAARDRGRELGG